MKPDQGARSSPHSHLFTVRVWREELGDDQREWRGRVQCVTNGEAFYFRQWTELISLLMVWLEEGDGPGG